MSQFESHKQVIAADVRSVLQEEAQSFSPLKLLSPFALYKSLSLKGIGLALLLTMSLLGGLFCAYLWAFPTFAPPFFPWGVLQLVAGAVCMIVFVYSLESISFAPDAFLKTKKHGKKLTVEVYQEGSKTKFQFIFGNKTIYSFHANHNDHDSFIETATDIDNFVDDINQDLKFQRKQKGTSAALHSVLRNSKNLKYSPKKMTLSDSIVSAVSSFLVLFAALIFVTGFFVNRTLSFHTFDSTPTMKKVATVFEHEKPSFETFKKQVQTWSKADKKSYGLRKVLFTLDANNYYVRFDINKGSDKIYVLRWKNNNLIITDEDPVSSKIKFPKF